MKDAKEWVGKEPFQFNEMPTDERLVEVIKEIQLDAWKQGMIDAADIAFQYEPSGELGIPKAIQEASELRSEI